jgi:hypothetical protein
VGEKKKVETMNQASLMRHAAALMLALALCPTAAPAQTAPRYEVDASWPKDLPEGWITGQLGGVCTGEQDAVYVVNRRNITDEEKETSTSAPSIIKFAPTSRGPSVCSRRGTRASAWPRRRSSRA